VETLTIFNLQKYSIHDGPGIRTTVFLKGCPLSCQWCHNPESIDVSKEILFRDKKCIACGECIEHCPEKALSFGGKGILRESSKCTLCGICTELCPTEALQMAGLEQTVEQVMCEIAKDKIFYEESGGGVTFSGGEPLLQISALEKLLKDSKSIGLHTTVDTSGYAPWSSFERIYDHVDLFLFDLKHMDDLQHQFYTGVSNALILENLKRLVERGAKLWIRIPIIPSVNDDDTHIEALGKFLSSLNIQNVFILPYHEIAAIKYERLGRPYLLKGVKPPSQNSMEGIQSKLENYGLTVKIGG
jgi:pyruvate formate lyase activating enzyme